MLSVYFDSPIKLVAAEAGFLPPGPAVLFADILRGLCSAQKQLSMFNEENAVALVASTLWSNKSGQSQCEICTQHECSSD